jgi:hypothetical protein
MQEIEMGTPNLKIICYLLKTERQKMIHPNSYPAYNERHQKIIEMIDLTMDKYKTAANTQKMNEQVIIEDIIQELDRKREIAINKKQKTLLKDEVLEYGEEEDAIDYLLFIIREWTTGMERITITVTIKDHFLFYIIDTNFYDYRTCKQCSTKLTKLIF